MKLGANLRHLLRPETIESVFWMYRATKKQKWLDAAARPLGRLPEARAGRRRRPRDLRECAQDAASPR